MKIKKPSSNTQKTTVPNNYKYLPAFVSRHRRNRQYTASLLIDKNLRRRLTQWNKTVWNTLEKEAQLKANKWIRRAKIPRFYDLFVRSSRVLPKDLMIAPTSIIRSDCLPKACMGLFTLRDIKQGELIGLYLGKRYSGTEWDETIEQLDDSQVEEMYKYAMVIDDDTIDASNPKTSTFLRYMNSPFLGEEPDCENCYFSEVGNPHGKRDMAVIALRDIKKGEELLVHYSKTYFFTRYDLVLARGKKTQKIK